MRQIDNMTSQEIDTLALKGMTAPHKAPDNAQINKSDHNRKFYTEREHIREIEIRKQLGVDSDGSIFPLDDWLKSNESEVQS